MKRTALLIMLTAFFSLPLLLSCGDQKEAEKPKTSVTYEDVKKEAKQAMETVKDYAQEKKEEYLRQIEAKLEELDKEMQELQAKAKSSATELKEESKAEFNQSMETLSKKKQAVAEKLDTNSYQG